MSSADHESSLYFEKKYSANNNTDDIEEGLEEDVYNIDSMSPSNLTSTTPNSKSNEIDDENDFYLFNWKYGSVEDTKNPNWLVGNDHSNDWFLTNAKPEHNIVMNYGLYKKKIFREIGMYNSEYRYYAADGDMAERAYYFGYKCKDLRHIKVCSLITDKVAQYFSDDMQILDRNVELYKNKVLPDTIEFLK